MHPRLNGVRAVFFDAVGTILMPAEPVAATYRRIALKHGLDLAESVIRARLGAAHERQEQLDRRADWRTNETRELQRWQGIVAETFEEAGDPEACFRELWAWYTQPPAWRANPDAQPVLKALHQRGLVVGLASNFDARLIELIGNMDALALLRERCVVSSIVTWRKPAGAFFNEVARMARCAPGEILFVGDDHRNDYEGAIAAGLQALLLGPARREGPPVGRLDQLLDLVAVPAPPRHEGSLRPG